MNTNDPGGRLMCRPRRDCILPQAVLITIFVTAVVLTVLGITLLGIAPRHPNSKEAFDAAGAVLLGIGLCLLAILLLFCCYAYCIGYVKDQETQTTEDNTTETQKYSYSANDSTIDSPFLHNVVRDTTQSVGEINRATKPKEPNLVDKPPSALKTKSPSINPKIITEPKRVRLSPEVGILRGPSLDLNTPVIAQSTHNVTDNTPPFPGELPLNIDETYIPNTNQPLLSGSPYITVRSSSNTRYYPDSKYHRQQQISMPDAKYAKEEYSTVAYSRGSTPVHYDKAPDGQTSHAITSRIYRESPVQYAAYSEVNKSAMSTPGVVEYPAIRVEPPQQSSTSCTTSTAEHWKNIDYPINTVLLRPSERRPMTFEKFSASKMSVYDNLENRINSLV